MLIDYWERKRRGEERREKETGREWRKGQERGGGGQGRERETEGERQRERK